MALEQPSAVRFFAPDHPALNIKLRKRLEQRRCALLEELLGGSDWGNYNYRKGLVQGIDEAIQHCLDIENEMQDKRP
jgi:hypothetical protein